MSPSSPSIDVRKIIWESIEKRVETFIREKQDALLINSPQGTGKTHSTLKTLLDMGVRFVYFGESHERIEKLIRDIRDMTGKDIFHFKGRESRVDPLDPDSMYMCDNIRTLRSVLRAGISTEFLCSRNRKSPGFCYKKYDCEYHRMLDRFMEINISEIVFLVNEFAAAYQFLNTGLVDEFDPDVLIFDEHCMDAFCDEITFTEKRLIEFNELIDNVVYNIIDKAETDTSIDLCEIQEFYDMLLACIIGLKNLWTDEERYLKNNDIIEAVLKELNPKQLLNIREKDTLWVPKQFEEAYTEYILDYASKGVYHYDFLHILIDIYRMLIDCYRKAYIGTLMGEYIRYNRINCALFYEHKKKHPFDEDKREAHAFRYIRYNINMPLDTPVIFLDATGTKELYSLILNYNVDNPDDIRDVYEFDSSKAIKVMRNIIQIPSYKYTKASLNRKQTRDHIFSKILQLVTYYYMERNKKIFITTYKTHMEELRTYLNNNGLTKKHFEVTYFENMKGDNIKDLMDKTGVLIILGTPEPNILLFYEKVTAFFLYGDEVSNERKKDKIHYEDDRYEILVMPHREHLIEHVIERLRFIIESEYKLCILLTSIPISFDTTPQTIDSILIDKGILPDDSPVTKMLRYIRDNDNVTARDFYMRFKNNRVACDFGGITKFRDKILIQTGYVELVKSRHNKQTLHVTKKGCFLLSRQ